MLTQTTPGVIPRILAQIEDAKSKIARINQSVTCNSSTRFEDTLDAVYADDIRSYWEKKLQELEELLEKYSKERRLPSIGIQVGEKIKLLKLGSKRILDYRLSDSVELFKGERCISAKSPIGRAVISKDVGHTISVDTPNGLNRYRIMARMNLS